MHSSSIERIRSLFGKSSSTVFQVLSDLHLEVGEQYNTFKIPPSAPYLLLAGDIGRLLDYASFLAFLATQATHFEQIFLVLGNHEFYGLSINAGLEQARKLEKEVVLGGKLVLLHQTRFDIPNSKTTILGCTLWSKVSDDARDVVRMKVKDFQKIDGWTVDDHNAAHESDFTWLQDQAAQVRRENQSKAKGEVNRNILVVTHHAPSMQETSSPENVDNPWSSAFATDLLDGRDWGDVKVWVFGHTHFSTEFWKNGIKVLSNQRGYILPGGNGGRSEERGGSWKFDVSKVVRI